MLLNKIKKFLYKKGYKINKVSKLQILNEDQLYAIKNEIGSEPVLFDVGANVGQTITKFKKAYPESFIHSFEPSKICFETLTKNNVNSKKLKLNNNAVGAEKGSLEFNEYSWSGLNSLLKRSFTNATIIDNYFVDVITIDDYCKENSIPKINFLKTDTEGFELNVLKGADSMFSNNNIQFVFVEVFFYENYIGQSSFGDVYNYLIQKGFNLVRFYNFEYTEQGFSSRTDALFVNEKFKN